MLTPKFIFKTLVKQKYYMYNKVPKKEKSRK